MKKKNTFKIIAVVAVVIAAVIALAAVLVFKMNANKYERNGAITSFSFSGSYGLGGAVGYTIVRQGDKVVLKYECFGYDEKDDVSVEKAVDAKCLDELASVIKEKGVAKWDGFDKSEDGVLDGSGFSLKVEYDDGKKIDAHGYMIYPDNYDEVQDAFDEILSKLVEE